MASNSTSRNPTYNPLPATKYAFEQTARFIGNLAQGNMGTLVMREGRSARSVPVRELLVDSYIKSMGLIFIALGLAATIGIPIGLFAAARQHSAWATSAMTLTLLGISLPSFAVAALLQIAEIYWFRTFGFRLIPVGGFGWDAHVVIPSMVLAARPLAHLARIAYMSFSEVLSQEYMRTADAKGLLKHYITRAHAYPNAAMPLLTGLGVSLRFSLGSLPVVEYFLGWPGIGATLLEAIRLRQATAAASMALVLGLTFMLVNLAIDLLYRYLDPRIRTQSL